MTTRRAVFAIALGAFGCGIAPRTVEELDVVASAGAAAGRTSSAGGHVSAGGPSGPSGAIGGMGGFEASPTECASGNATPQQDESELLADQQQWPRNLAVNATHAYWANYEGGNVMRVALSGGTPEVVSEERYPYAVTLDDRYVYFTTLANNGNIRRVPLAGGEVEVLANSEFQATTIAVDRTHVYWGNWGNPGISGSIRRLSLEDGEPVTFASDLWEGDLLLDADNVYWMSFGEVKKQSKSGSVAAVVLAAPVSAVALSGDYLYWVRYDSVGVESYGVVGRSTKDGLKREELVRIQTLPAGLAVDATAVYYATGYGQVMRVALDTGLPHTVASGRCQCFVAASDATFVYWIEAASSGARIQRFAK